MPVRDERSVGARRGRRGRRWDSPSSGAPLPRAVRGLRTSRALRSLRRRRREGSRRRRGAAQAAPGPGEWSNLTAGTRRRRAGGNGGGGGGAGQHREAWAVTRASERGPMVLEGPRRPVLQVRRAPAEPLCVRGGERLRPASRPPRCPGPRGRPGPGPALRPGSRGRGRETTRADGAASSGPERRGLRGRRPPAGLCASPDPGAAPDSPLWRDFVRALRHRMGPRAPPHAAGSAPSPLGPAPGL